MQTAFFKSANRQIGKSANQQAQSTKVRGEDVALALGLMGSMVAMLAHGLVDNTLFFPDLALVFFLTLALAQRAHEVSSSDAGPSLV